MELQEKLVPLPTAAVGDRLAEALHLQAMEANPLRADEVSMFEMFEQEDWSPDDRRAYITRRFKDRKGVAASNPHFSPGRYAYDEK